MKDKEVGKFIADHLSIADAQAEKIIEKAVDGGEVESDLATWLDQRFLPNLVWIDEIGYTKMSINALKIVNKTAATDYGSSRQRDFGQMWGDMTRGYLAEYAFSQFLRQNWEIESTLDHETGELSD